MVGVWRFSGPVETAFKIILRYDRLFSLLCDVCAKVFYFLRKLLVVAELYFSNTLACLLARTHTHAVVVAVIVVVTAAICVRENTRFVCNDDYIVSGAHTYIYIYVFIYSTHKQHCTAQHTKLNGKAKRESTQKLNLSETFIAYAVAKVYFETDDKVFSKHYPLSCVLREILPKMRGMFGFATTLRHTKHSNVGVYCKCP